MTKSLLVTAALALAAGGAWIMTRGADPLPVISQNVDTTEAEAAPDEPLVDEIAISDMIQGNPDAPVQVIEYASYTCPHCASFHANQYQQLKENYIDTGLIGFTFREVYFDQPGLWASMVARCGGEMRYFGLSGLLFEGQQDWARAGDGMAIVTALRNIGKVAGITEDELDVCLTDADKAQALVAWYRANAEADEITSTPSFIINGEQHGNMSYAEFATLLDEKLAEATE